MSVDVCHFGDCRETLGLLADLGTKVQMCVTSPPYFGLRDYGHAGQLGLEKTPSEYVAGLVEVFRLVREVLADDGTLWLNLGDSYRPVNRGHKAKPRKEYPSGIQAGHMHADNDVSDIAVACQRAGLKDKDLLGIPWRVAFALQADGWYLRQDIIWNKPNPMPESVRDRCTKAHEYVFLLSKSKKYYFDGGAISEPVAASSVTRLQQPTLAAQKGSHRVPGKTNGPMRAVGGVDTRNRRSVWTITTKPYKGAHFATFPPEIPELCIKAGSRPGDIVLDPFFGSGTTGQVAKALGRHWIGCELNAEYEALQIKRLAKAG